MVDFPWLSSFNGVYNIDIDLYLYIYIYSHPFLSFKPNKEWHPSFREKSGYGSQRFFVAWFFGFPDGSQGEWYQGPSQGGSNWNTGERSWEAKNINVLMEELLRYLQSVDMFLAWMPYEYGAANGGSFWWSCFFFVPRSCGGKWSNLTSIGACSPFQSC